MLLLRYCIDYLHLQPCFHELIVYRLWSLMDAILHFPEDAHTVLKN
uniref:Uncharacterized protein n=1 Tax=Arundo donax TaxID=35708 RepID=A0A0A9A7W8_ARUDO